MNTTHQSDSSRVLFLLVCVAAVLLAPAAVVADDFTALQDQFAASQQGLLRKYCISCHNAADKNGELDLERFHSVSDMRQDVIPWQRAVELLDEGEMPPKDAEQRPSPEELRALRQWIRAVLDADAKANAGDPGPVVLRRLNNAEFNYTIQDLTGVSLEPAREFPVDSAAGEGFTNVGNALVMSPAMVQKYLDAGKEIASHAVLLPGGIRFSRFTTQRDWTNEKLDEIRALYARYSDNSGATSVNLQGIQFETNGGGRLPLERFIRATLVHRDALDSGATTLADVARLENLNEKYMTLLWGALKSQQPSVVLDQIRERWRAAGPEGAGEISLLVAQWQQSLWRFTTIGHIGKRDGPRAWQVPVDPIAARQEIRLKVPAPQDGRKVTLYLTASDVSDGNVNDFAVWENPRFVAPGQPDLLLKDVRRAVSRLTEWRTQVISSTSKCLQAAAEAGSAADADAISTLAEKHGINRGILAAWCRYLGIGQGEARIDSWMTQKLERAESYDFVKGWIGPDALSVLANSSDQFVRIPGDMHPHSVGVHPSPKLRAVIGWRSPITAAVQVTGRVQRAHIGCGNGVTWVVEVRRGTTRQRLAAGVADGREEQLFGPFANLAIQPGDLICLSVGPRDGEHSCDMTAVSLTVDAGTGLRWDLADDVSPDILAGNPHPDRMGNSGVWNFYSESDAGQMTDAVVPAGSLLAKWQAAAEPRIKSDIAREIQSLLEEGIAEIPADSPDAALHRQLVSFSGPLFSAVRTELLSNPDSETDGSLNSDAGLDPRAFGRHPEGPPISPADLCVQAPSVLEVSIPADFVEGFDFVTTTALHTETGTEGTVQMQVLTAKPERLSELAASTSTPAGGKATWSDGEKPVSHNSPILASDNSAARRRLLQQFDEFRNLFPAALCYTRIVPVDEVVTLTLYYREDDHLKRLMLSDAEVLELDRLWDEMHFISQDALALVDAYEQLWQFATQDADPSAFTPMREGIMQRAEHFRQVMKDAEPVHVQAVLDIAGRAWRRPLSDAEKNQLTALYQRLRSQELSHETAVRLLLARVFVTPAFLYRTEQARPGQNPTTISNAELASRLSYFLWSSMPDSELRTAAEQGLLNDPDVLVSQTRRMLKHPRIRRMAIEFGCQWLHIRDFDQLDEKSEQHFPEFRELRKDMYEESILFFEDFLREDRSILNLLDADYTFVNGRLAAFYGFQGTEGEEWRKTEQAQTHSRGGILAMAATLAKQSGASRTSPILRGNWVSEFLLGDKLPRPPQGVPVLPEVAPADLTERQMIEAHSTDPACAKCHARIDSFGFALEQFDTIGRLRTKDANGHAIDVAAVLPDGTPVTGLEGLRDYILNKRRADFLETFCRRLLGYSLGRSVQLSDEPLLTEMLQKLAQNDYRVSVAIESIVVSPQFRMIRGADRSRSVAATE